VRETLDLREILSVYTEQKRLEKLRRAKAALEAERKVDVKRKSAESSSDDGPSAVCLAHDPSHAGGPGVQLGRTTGRFRPVAGTARSS
jgi:hypothetical protein